MTAKAKVLVADDEPDCIAFVREALADEPYEVIAAADGEEALAAVFRERPDLIILDVQMPKRGGFEVFQRLRSDEEFAAVPVIMLTAIADRVGIDITGEDVAEYVGSEPDAFIDKPIEPIVLRQAVRRLLKGPEPC